MLKSFKKIIAFGMSGSGSSCFGIFNTTHDFINDEMFETLRSKKNILFGMVIKRVWI